MVGGDAWLGLGLELGLGLGPVAHVVGGDACEVAVSPLRPVVAAVMPVERDG